MTFFSYLACSIEIEIKLRMGIFTSTAASKIVKSAPCGREYIWIFPESLPITSKWGFASAHTAGSLVGCKYNEIRSNMRNLNTVKILGYCDTVWLLLHRACMNIVRLVTMTHQPDWHNPYGKT